MKINFKDPNEFKKLLLMNGFSQKEFADTIGISAPYFSQVVSGERTPSGKLARKIVEKFNLEFEDIFFINDACKSYQNRNIDS